VAENLLLVAVAYPCQFLAPGLGLMLFGLLFRHNLFYLQRIYQRSRGRRLPLSQQIVLDFNDMERCFGLRVLHSTFNFEVILLITGGILILGSRVVNVDATPLGVQYDSLIQSWFSRAQPDALDRAMGLGDLFPDVGQMMLGMAWFVCFIIVAMPSAVKFLPLLHKHVTLVGRREYLLEFVPETTAARLDTQEDVDRAAAKFARSSFWPAGDERARTLYTLAYFVFFYVLVPAPPTSSRALAAHAIAVFALSYVCMKTTFWLFRKVLMNIDATLAHS
jgi:hypothetical protein